MPDYIGQRWAECADNTNESLPSRRVIFGPQVKVRGRQLNQRLLNRPRVVCPTSAAGKAPMFRGSELFHAGRSNGADAYFEEPHKLTSAHRRNIQSRE
jgi:hypothetical protein